MQASAFRLYRLMCELGDLQASQPSLGSAGTELALAAEPVFDGLEVGREGDSRPVQHTEYTQVGGGWMGG